MIREIEVFHVWKREIVICNRCRDREILLFRRGSEFVKKCNFNREIVILTLFFVISCSWPLSGNILY